MIGIASDDLLLASVLLFSLLTLWDSLNQSVVTEKIEKQRDIVEHPQKVKQPTKLIEKPVEKKSKNESVKEKKPVAIKASGETSDGVTSTPVVAAKKKKELPFLPGCEPDGAAAKEMMTKYPDVDIEDIVRYLVARKGNVKDASEMLEKVKVWRAKHFPLKRADMKPAIETGCMFAHGHAKDKSPVIYFRYNMRLTFVMHSSSILYVVFNAVEVVYMT